MAAGDSSSQRLADAAVYVFLAAICILVLVPIYWIVATSFKPTSEILVTPTSLLTAHPTLDHYKVALAGDFRRYLVNSLIAAGGATALGFLLVGAGGLGLRKIRLSGFRRAAVVHRDHPRLPADRAGAAVLPAVPRASA